MGLFDIIIVNYNSTDYLIDCLHSVHLTQHKSAPTIFVQDNASSDGFERLPSLFPHLNIERNKRNIGFGKAVNQAVVKGEGEYVILLNPDARIVDGFFDKIHHYMDTHQDVGVLGPKILDHDGALQNSARAFPTPLTAFFGRNSFLSKRFPKNPITSKNLLSLKSDGATPMPVDWVSGACMVIRRKAIDEVGLLDERFFMYWEDTDWCRRMWRQGWKVIYYPRAVVTHFVGGSSRKRVYRSIIDFHLSVFRLFDKYASPKLCLLRPLVLGGLLMRLLIVLISLRINNFFANDSPEKIVLDAPRAFRKERKKRIRILRVISRLNIGGPAVHVYMLTRGLDPDQFESLLVSGRISPQEGDMSYLFRNDTHRLVIFPELQREIRPDLDFRAFLRILKLLSRLKPDIVDTHTAKAGTSTRIAVLLYRLFTGSRVHTVHTFHGHVFKGYFNRMTSALFITIERLLAAVTTRIIVISSSQESELVNQYRIAPAAKISRIPLGFHLKPFLNAKLMKGRFRSLLKIPENAFLIGIVGRLVPIKHHDMFLNAAKILLQENPGKDIKFLVIGDGELRHYLESACRSLNISNEVVFTGWIQDAPSVYADLDILGLTSRNEGTPVSIIESMAASVPVIATDVGGVRDLLGKSNTDSNGFTVCERGILVSPGDDRGFAQGLSYLMNEEARKQSKRAAAARSYAMENFDCHRLFRDMENLYRELMSQ